MKMGQLCLTFFILFVLKMRIKFILFKISENKKKRRKIYLKFIGFYWKHNVALMKF